MTHTQNMCNKVKAKDTDHQILQDIPIKDSREGAKDIAATDPAPKHAHQYRGPCGGHGHGTSSSVSDSPRKRPPEKPGAASAAARRGAATSSRTRCSRRQHTERRCCHRTAGLHLLRGPGGRWPARWWFHDAIQFGSLCGRDLCKVVHTHRSAVEARGVGLGDGISRLGWRDRGTSGGWKVEGRTARAEAGRWRRAGGCLGRRWRFATAALLASNVIHDTMYDSHYIVIAGQGAVIP